MRDEKLLIWLKHRYLGDAVMATPLLRRVREEYQDVTILAAPHIAQMLQEETRDYTIIAPGEAKKIGEFFKEVRRIKQMRFDDVILVNRSARSALISWLAEIPRRIGHTTEGRGLFLTKRVQYDRVKFEAECYGDLAHAAGIQGGDYSRVSLSVTSEERAEGAALLEGADVGVQPGARYAGKMLPAEGLARVIDALQSEGHRVALFGGKEEAESAKALCELVQLPMVNLVGKTSIRQSMGAASNLRLMIGGSTGMMHIARAVGAPCVFVFGWELSSKWGHFYPPNKVIQIPSRLITDMDPEEVLAASREVLALQHLA